MGISHKSVRCEANEILFHISPKPDCYTERAGPKIHSFFLERKRDREESGDDERGESAKSP